MYEQFKTGHFVYEASLSQATEFKILELNRDVINNHIEKLVKSYITNGYLKIPIIVNEKLEIIDGQHRYYAWITYHENPENPPFNICFNICEGYGPREAQLLNVVNGKGWGVPDFIKKLATEGNKNYKLFAEFIDDTGLGVAEATALIKNLNNRAGGQQYSKIKNGKFIVTEDDIRKAKNAVSILDDFNSFKNYKSIQFIGPYLALKNTKDFDLEAFKLGWKAISETELNEEFIDKRSGKDKIKPITGVEKMTKALKKIYRHGRTLKKVDNEII
jgi:hypothetical protein